MMRKRRYTVAKDSFFSVFSVARKRLNTARPLAATKHVGPNGVRHWGERRSPLRSTEKSSRRAKRIGISNTGFAARQRRNPNSRLQIPDSTVSLHLRFAFCDLPFDLFFRFRALTNQLVLH